MASNIWRIYACTCLAVFTCNLWYLFGPKPRATRDRILALFSAMIVAVLWPIAIVVMLFFLQRRKNT